MTYKILTKVIEENNTPKDVKLTSDYIPPKTIHFPSDIHGVRVHEGKEQIRVLCSDDEYHWIDYNRYRSRKEIIYD